MTVTEPNQPVAQEDDRGEDARALELIRQMLLMGVVPRTVEVGSVKIQVASVERHREERPPQPGTYLNRALDERARKLGSVG